jgi:hypothetical protein
MQPYKIRYKSWRYSQANRRSKIDAALLTEELVEIHRTPTPNAMAESRKIVLIMCWCPFTIDSVYIYTLGLTRVLVE